MTDLHSATVESDLLTRLGGEYVGSLPLPAATPVLVVATGTADPTLLHAITEHCRRGGRAVIAFGPGAHGVQPTGDPGAAAWALGPELLGASIENPLLAERRTTALTASGNSLRLFAARAVTTTGTVLARLATGEPVVVEQSVGLGSIVVAGCASLFETRWLTIDDNAEFVTELLGSDEQLATREPTGTVDIVAHQRPHAAPPVIEATSGWLQPRPAGIDLDEVATIAGRLVRTLPEAVFDALAAFCEAPPAAGALLLKAMPVGEVPPTPSTPTSPTAKDLTSETTLLTVARALGQPVGYEPELGGRLVQNICPTAQAADRQVSTSSKVELMFHTEAAFHPHRPRFLLLLCLRQDPERVATTTLASIRELLDALSARTRRVLFEPRFRTAADESYVGGRPTQLGAAQPILSGAWDSPTMVFDADLMVGTDAEADAAIAALSVAINARHTGVALEPGDLLVVDNTVAVHGRSPFRAHFDGTDRWLQRAFVVADLVPSAADRHGRIITTRFAR